MSETLYLKKSFISKNHFSPHTNQHRSGILTNQNQFFLPTKTDLNFLKTKEETSFINKFM